MKNIYTTLVLLFVAILAVAQPGYLGKKTSISYDLNSSKIIKGVSYSGKGEGGLYSPYFNTMHSIRLDRVSGRKSSYGFGLSYSRTSLYYMDELTPKFYKDQNQYLPYKLHSLKASYNARAYLEDAGDIAPFGNYAEFSIGVNQLNVKDIVVDDYIASKIAPFISLAYGTQRVISNKYLFDISMRFTFYPTIIGNLFDEEDFEKYGRQIWQNNQYVTPPVPYDEFISFVKKNALLRTQQMDLFTIKLGFGRLIK